MKRTEAHLTKFNLAEYLIAYLRHKIVADHIPQKSTVLDIGCGFKAHFLHHNHYRIAQGIGLDIDVSRSRYPHIQLLRWDLNNPAFPELPPVDVVTCMAVIEHVEDPHNLLSNIHRALKENGTLLLTAPTWRAKPILELLSFSHINSSEEIADHKRYFNKHEIVSMCKRAEFQSISHRFFEFGCNNFVIAKK